MIPTYRKVLVTTDLSVLGNSAIPHAYTALAERVGTVILCHVLELPALPNPLYAHYSPEERLSTKDREALRRKLSRKLERLVPPEFRRHRQVATEIRVVAATGSVHETICEQAKTHDVDLIVMASHGHSGLTRLFLGSVAERVLQSVDRPILIVRGGATGAMRETRRTAERRRRRDREAG